MGGLEELRAKFLKAYANLPEPEMELVVVIIDDKDKSNDCVDIGSTVTVQESNYPEEAYYVVGPKEADPLNGRISYESPIGKSLLSHKVGDSVQVETPGGKVNLKIIKIN